MLKSYFKRSSYIELVSEQRDDVNSQYKAYFRVTDNAAWGSALIDILRFVEDEEYVVSVRKEYFLREGQPAFVWTMIFTGPLETIAEDIGPMLCDPNKRPSPAPLPSAPTTPKPSVIQERPPDSPILSERTVQSEDGLRIVKKVRLPFVRGVRDMPAQQTTKKLGDKGLGVYVSIASGASL